MCFGSTELLVHCDYNIVIFIGKELARTYASGLTSNDKIFL